MTEPAALTDVPAAAAEAGNQVGGLGQGKGLSEVETLIEDVSIDGMCGVY